MIFDRLQPDDDFLECMGNNIWLMDNHKWAFYIWECHSIDSGYKDGLSLVHIDYHFDHNDDIQDGSSEFVAAASRDKDTIFELVKNSSGPITYDSFIAPFVRLGRLDHIFWLCRQTDEDLGFDKDLLERNSCEQVFTNGIEDLVRQNVPKPYIFDFCLDYFCDNDKDMFRGPVWSAQDIQETIIACGPLVANAALVTASLSFGYSGTEDDTREIARAVLPRFVEMRGAAT